MAKLSFYVSDEVETVIRRKAKQVNMSLPEYLAKVVERASEVQEQGPEGYIELFDDWQGEPLERPSPLRSWMRQPSCGHRLFDNDLACQSVIVRLLFYYVYSKTHA